MEACFTWTPCIDAYIVCESLSNITRSPQSRMRILTWTVSYLSRFDLAAVPLDNASHLCQSVFSSAYGYPTRSWKAHLQHQTPAKSVGIPSLFGISLQPTREHSNEHLSQSDFCRQCQSAPEALEAMEPKHGKIVIWLHCHSSTAWPATEDVEPPAGLHPPG